MGRADFGSDWTGEELKARQFVSTIPEPHIMFLANEGGVADPNQPQGRMFFAPTAADLDQVFDAVAKDLLVRLAI